MPRKPQARTSRPGEYHGAKAICERLGISRSTLYHWMRTRNLLVYARRSKGYKACLYTNDALIDRWHVAEALNFQNTLRQDKQIASTTPATLRPRSEVAARSPRFR